MSILAAPDGVQERVMTVKGLTRDIALALHRVAEILMQVQQERQAKSMGGMTTDHACHGEQQQAS